MSEQPHPPENSDLLNPAPAGFSKTSADVRSSRIEEACRAPGRCHGTGRPPKKRPDRIGRTVARFFSRVYVVIPVGRAHKRGKKSNPAVSFLVNLIFIIYAATFLFILLFMAAYHLKSEAGINIFPDKHLSDFFTSGP
jgi:hypothetical protein